MDLAAIPQALWFFLPAYVANPMAVVFGGGTPIDFGRTLRDGERLFGDGKTWRGVVGGLLLSLAVPAWSVPRFFSEDALLRLVAIIVITPALHRAVNLLGYRIGKKHEPW